MNRSERRCYFFDQGIRFVCRECGDCCTGDPGLIRVSTEEITGISGFLNMPRGVLIKTYLYPVLSGYSVREGIGGNCLFYENSCRIYPVRPRQCRTYPFWIKNMRSEKRWKEVQNDCPGIGSGRFYSREEILQILGGSDI